MNKKRREEVAEAKRLLSMAINFLENVRNDEEDAFDNLSDGLQQTMRGEQMEENINCLEETVDMIKDAIDNLNEIM